MYTHADAADAMVMKVTAADVAAVTAARSTTETADADVIKMKMHEDGCSHIELEHGRIP